MNISDIRDIYYSGGYTCNMEVPRVVREDHVFDADLSIRRNREMAAEHNENVKKLREEKLARQADLDKKFNNDIEDYIVDNYNLSKAQASLIRSFTYVHKHSCMSDYFYYIDEFAGFAESIAEADILEEQS